MMLKPYSASTGRSSSPALRSCTPATPTPTTTACSAVSPSKYVRPKLGTSYISPMNRALASWWRPRRRKKRGKCLQHRLRVTLYRVEVRSTPCRSPFLQNRSSALEYFVWCGMVAPCMGNNKVQMDLGQAQTKRCHPIRFVPRCDSRRRCAGVCTGTVVGGDWWMR